jgi:hypothetical protein
VLLTGSNGAGKSTALALLASQHLVPPDSVTVLGEEPRHREHRNQASGLLLDEAHLLALLVHAASQECTCCPPGNSLLPAGRRDAASRHVMTNAAVYSYREALGILRRDFDYVAGRSAFHDLTLHKDTVLLARASPTSARLSPCHLCLFVAELCHRTRPIFACMLGVEPFWSKSSESHAAFRDLP